MARTYTWHFPLSRPQAGILQGNGTMGVMIWGEASVLKITLGRADLWDHRGGMPWTERMSYANIRACLESNDEQALRELFEKTPSGPGRPQQPTILPVGRMELDFGRGAVLRQAVLDIDSAEITVVLSKGGKRLTARIISDVTCPLVWVSFGKGTAAPRIKAVPSWHHVGKELQDIGFAAPTTFTSKSASGWVQTCPADPAVCVAYGRDGSNLLIVSQRGQDARAARMAAAEGLESARDRGLRALRRTNASWWRDYWKDVPKIRLPNERLLFLYEYGMYKFASFTNPAGVPATLQGTWIEEYRLPPWSSDYHFNINVQMCYWPAYHGNRLANLKPLFDMIGSWMPALRHNAKVFVGIDDGLMLPHAVDDRCTCMGGFWTGSIDHACTAWMALMMYRYYRYSLDREFLRTRAYPFMVGAMRVYEEMLQREGGRFVLPVSVSPEYRGAQMNAWGRNASFQLACIHALCEALLSASAELGQPPKGIWSEIVAKLPKACLIGPPGREMIALWEGTPLEESHRHHSHLAGITPFDIFDFDDPAWREILERSIGDWILRGPAKWTGWCLPWAAAIHTRFGNGEAAETYLEMFQRVFTNEGHGTLHDADVPGISLMGAEATRPRPVRREFMQMDGGMGAATAIQEMLLHTRRGVNYLFLGVPRGWADVSFQSMRTDGAFLVSATRQAGQVQRVEVLSTAGGVFRLGNPWSAPAAVQRGRGRRERALGPVLDVTTSPGERIVLKPLQRT